MKELEGSKTGSGGPRMTCMIFFFLRPASHQLDLSRSLNGARCGKPDGRMWPDSRCFLYIIFFFIASSMARCSGGRFFGFEHFTTALQTEGGGGQADGQAVGGQAFFPNLTLGSIPESMYTRGRGAIVRYSQTAWRQQRSAQRYQLRYFDPIEELAKTTAASGQVYDVIILFGRCSDCALAATADCIRPGADLSRFAEQGSQVHYFWQH